MTKHLVLMKNDNFNRDRYHVDAFLCDSELLESSHQRTLSKLNRHILDSCKD